MRIIGSVKEDLSVEKRVSITPEIVKKYTAIGLAVNLEKKYAEHLGINDEDYKKNGADISFSKEEVFEKVRDSLVDALGVDDDEVTPEATLVGDLGAESIDFLDNRFRKSIRSIVILNNTFVCIINLMHLYSKCTSVKFSLKILYYIMIFLENTV